MTAVTVRGETAVPLVQPTVLDRAVTWFSPRLGIERMHARAQLALAGQYLGARTNRRATQEWHPRAASPNDDLLGDLATLRARSADLERNDPIAGGAVANQLTSVVGPGLQLNPRIDRGLLRISDEQADAWESQAARLWQAHTQSTHWDAAGTARFARQTEQVLFGQLVRGDVLAVRRHLPGPGRLFGLAVQLIEADRVRSPLDRDTDTIIAGVEFDAGTGTPVAYHVASTYPGRRLGGGGTAWTRVPRYDDRGEPLAILIGEHRRPDALRSAPWLTPVIEPLKQLGTFSHAELSAAVIAAFFTVFVKSPNVIDPDGPTGSPWHPDSLQPSAAGNPPSAASDLRLGPGMIADLAPGEEIQIANPARPNAQFDPFFQAMVQQIAVALGMPVEVIMMRYTSSYSASRAAILQAWRVYGKRRTELVADWCTPCYHWLLAEAIAAGRLSAPGFFGDPLVRAAWCGADWVGPTMPELDPVKAVTAAILRMDATLSTAEQETAALTGGNWERNFAQVLKERRMMADAGIQPARPLAEPVEATT